MGVLPLTEGAEGSHLLGAKPERGETSDNPGPLNTDWRVAGPLGLGDSVLLPWEGSSRGSCP